MTVQTNEAAALGESLGDVGSAAQPVAVRLRALSIGGWLLAVTAVGGCAFAFVGLAASSFWTDELFTLFVIGRHGGPAEVLRRALTDTHPPAYYLLLYAWSHLFGLGETALRSLSALLAVGAVAVFARATRGVFTREARAFGAAVAATSPLCFYQAQNIRNYSLCFLLTALLLWLAVALRRRVRAEAGFPLGLWAALTTTALVDAMSHFYGLLGAGALIFALMATLPGWRLRGALAASGLLIVASTAADFVTAPVAAKSSRSFNQNRL